MEQRDRILLRVPEAAQALSISVSKMYELVAAGKIRSLRVGRAVRVSRRELETWVEQQLAGDASAL